MAFDSDDKNKNTVNKILLISSFLFLVACNTAPKVADIVHVGQEGSTQLAKQQSEIGNKVQVYSIPIMIEKPKDGTLTIDFKIKSAGHCITSYEPTVFYLNDELIAEFDFRRYFLKTKINKDIMIDKSLFNVGLNTLTIETGECQYDIDVLELDNLKLNF